MTLPTILYFASIFLTCALSGFMALYAWKHRQMPGALPYAGLALGECLLALMESLSVLSPSSAWASFWFQTRYLIGAWIGICWFVFALEYSGRKAWISKRLLAGLLIIPVVTQFTLLSNSLLGLWMKQEASFIQKGPFWIADISTRIPGLGYLTHVFYTLILTLTGIALMLLTAWKLRREFIGQALLLAGAGLTAFVFVVNSLFSFLPKTDFNLFTPGIGLSVILVALAIFRFQFLKRAPARENAAPLANIKPQGHRSLAVFFLIFILFASGLAAVGYLAYQDYEKQFRVEVESQLSAIAELKVNQLEVWRSERLGDAYMFYQNPAFTALAQRYFESPADAQAQTQLQIWLDKFQAYYHYMNIILLDSRGVERISAPAVAEPPNDYLIHQVAAALDSGQVTMLDFHRDTATGPIHLAILVPILDPNGAPLGALVLRIDPNIYLYPMLQQWPTLSQSAETLLVRRDGESVLFLNPLRFQPDAELNLRVPLTDTQVLAVQAVTGAVGVVEGRDYRSVAVIGYVDAIPDSPWFLVARMDTAEVYAPLRERVWLVALFLGGLILAAGAGLLLVWRQQGVRYYRMQLETMEALRASEEKLKATLEIMPLGVSVLNTERKIVYQNSALSKILNLTEAGLANGDFASRSYLRPDGTPMPAAEFASARAIREQRVIYNVETGVVTEGGNLIWTEVSAVPLQLADWNLVIVTRDITERKRTEEVLRQSEERLRAILDTTPFPIALVDTDDNNIEYWSRSALTLFGHTAPTAAEWYQIAYPDPDYQSDVLKRWKPVVEQARLSDQAVKAGEYRVTCRDGSVRICDLYAAFVDGKLIVTFNDITERKQAEEKLITSEVRYRRLFEAARDGILILDAESGVIVDVNPFLVEMLGISQEKIVGMELWELGFFKDIAANKANFLELQQKEYIRYEDLPLETAGGRQLHVEFVSNIYSVNHHKVVQCNIRDITERKQAEEALRESEERYHSLYENSSIGIYRTSPDGRILLANPSLVNMLGYSSFDELSTRDLTKAGYEPSYPRSHFLELIEKNGEVIGFESAWQRCDGSFLFVSESARAIRNSQGEVLYYDGTVEDITTRKQAEDALRESEEKFKYIFNNSVIGKSITLPSGEFNANRAFCDMLGYSQEELKGGKWQQISHPDDIELTQKIVDALLSGAKESERFTKRYLHKNGAVVWTDVSTALRRDKDGQPLYFITSVSNITERKQAEEQLAEYSAHLEQMVYERTRELRAAQEQLVRQERLAALGQLAGSIGHELRNPLGVIANAVYFLKMSQPEAGERVKEYLNIIEAETRRSDKIITDLLDFTRIKSLARKPVAVADLIRQTLERYPAPPLVEVSINLPVDLPAAYVDPNHILQVLGNLAVNAYQAMPNGGSLTMTAVVQRDMINISVHDTGIGIASENMQKLFEPLFTTKTRGIGLGLAVSKKLIEANGGRIEVQSEAGQGSTFTVYLPVYKE